MPTGVWPRPSFEIRFWSKVNKDGPVVRPELGPCWMWTAATNINGNHGGYGVMRIDKMMALVHRLSWGISFGRIPEGLNILHKCDNKPCVNPTHLFLGTQKENIADMYKKGRDRHVGIIGEDNHNAKLTNEIAAEIRAKYAGGGMKLRQLASLFGVSKSLVHQVVSGRRWVVAA